MLGRPSEDNYTDILDNSQIRSCPITTNDAHRALKIYGPDVATLEGKSVQKQNNSIPNHQTIKIPAPIIVHYNDVRLFFDIFLVNGAPYFHTILEWIKFCTVAPINNQSKQTLHMETQTAINLYRLRGFNVDHVPEVERSIHTIKERVRCLIQGLPLDASKS
jgi:hypothetical protein